MSRRVIWTLAISLALGVAACAPQPQIESRTVIVDGVGPVEVEQLNVQVASVDQANRSLIVQQRGNSWLVQVPEVFGDLSRVRQGDQIQIRRIEGAVIEVRRARRGARPEIVYSETTAGPFRNLPERYVVRSLTLTAKFEAFDPATGTVSYVGPTGPRTHVVVDPVLKSDLRRMKRGDMVDLIFAEAFQITLN